VARRPELKKSIDEFADAVGQLAKPSDLRLRRVHYILRRGIDRRRDILAAADALASGDMKAIREMPRALMRWKRSTGRAQALLHSFAVDRLTEAAAGAQQAPGGDEDE
jgi:hypothetical protein